MKKTLHHSILKEAAISLGYIKRESIKKMLEECGPVAPQISPLNYPTPPQTLPSQVRPPMPMQSVQPNPQLTPDQLNNPNFIATIIAQVLKQIQNQTTQVMQQMGNQGGGLNEYEDGIEEGTCGYTHQVNPKTGRRGKELKTPGGTKGMSGLNRTNFMRGSYS